MADRAVAGDMRLQPAPHRAVLLRLAGQHQRGLAGGQRHQLRVEQVRGDRVGQTNCAGRHFDDLHLGQLFAQLGVETLAVGEGEFVGEQHALVGDGDDVVVKGAGSNRRVRLAGEDRAGRVEPVDAGNRLARLAVLAGGVGAARLAIDEDFHARRIVAGAQPHVVGRALVAEGGGDRGVHGEVRVIGEGKLQLRQRLAPFMAAVGHRHEVGDGEVAASVGGVSRGRDGRGIGGPHRGGRHGIGPQRRAGIGHRRAKLLQPALIGPPLRQEETLRQPPLQIGPHLRQPLQRRIARPRDLPQIARRGEVAEAEPGVVVAGTDDAVEIDFSDHGLAFRRRRGASQGDRFTRVTRSRGKRVTLGRMCHFARAGCHFVEVGCGDEGAGKAHAEEPTARCGV